jgi:hypothetical protein
MGSAARRVLDVSTSTVDVSSRESVHALVETVTASGELTDVIHRALSRRAFSTASEDEER